MPGPGYLFGEESHQNGLTLFYQIFNRELSSIEPHRIVYTDQIKEKSYFCLRPMQRGVIWISLSLEHVY